MGNEKDDEQKKEPVSPLNIEEHEFDDFMKRVVRVPPIEKDVDPTKP